MKSLARIIGSFIFVLVSGFLGVQCFGPNSSDIDIHDERSSVFEGFLGGVFWGVFFLVIAYLFMLNQSKLKEKKEKAQSNETTATTSSQQPTSSNQVISDSNMTENELTKYKKMLEDGLISQDDYDAKKKQILGL